MKHVRLIVPRCLLCRPALILGVDEPGSSTADTPRPPRSSDELRQEAQDCFAFSPPWLAPPRSWNYLAFISCRNGRAHAEKIRLAILNWGTVFSTANAPGVNGSGRTFGSSSGLTITGLPGARKFSWTVAPRPWARPREIPLPQQSQAPAQVCVEFYEIRNLPPHAPCCRLTLCTLIQVAKDSALALDLAQQLDNHHNIGSALRPNSNADCAIGIDAVLSANAAEINAFPDFDSIGSTLEAPDSDDGDSDDDGARRSTASQRCPQKSREVARLDLIVSYLADVHSIDYFGGKAYADNGAMLLGQREVHRRFRSMLDQIPIAIADTRPNDSAPEKRARLENDSRASSGSHQSSTRRSKWGDWNGPWVQEIRRMLQYLSKEETDRRTSLHKKMMDACMEKLQSVTRQFCSMYCKKQNVQGPTQGKEGSSESWVVTWPLSTSTVRLAAPLSNVQGNASVPPTALLAAPLVHETNCVGSGQVPGERKDGVSGTEEPTADEASKVPDGGTTAVSEGASAARNAELSPKAPAVADATPPKPTNTFASSNAARTYVNVAAKKNFDAATASSSFLSHLSHGSFLVILLGFSCRFRWPKRHSSAM